MNKEKNDSKSPFDYIKSVSYTKDNILENPKDYQAFVVNKGLSYFPDTILFANEMNRLWMIPPEHQYNYYLQSIRKRNRFKKWNKRDELTQNTLNNIMEYYNCSMRIAKQYMNTMGEENIKYINTIMASRQ